MTAKNNMQPFVKKEILSVELTDATGKEILEYIFDVVEASSQKLRIYTPNPEIVMYASKHKSYLATLNAAEVTLCDGIGLFKAAELLGSPVKERISGVDFMEKLCKESVSKGVSVGFLGGRDGVAERAAECLSKRYPGLKVVFVGEEWPREYKGKSIKYKAGTNSLDTSYLPHDTKLDILFVAYGFPKQEEWIAEHIEKLPVRVMMGVGGAFDYLSGDISRAPKWMRDLGLEWLYRLVRQPWRISRQVVLPQFLLLILLTKLRIR